MANLRNLKTGERLITNTGKDLKNPYTILEKVKKGEIQSHYKSGGGLFDKVSFYKKNDLIKPHMHYIDEDRLEGICSKYMSDPKNIKDAFESIARSTEFRKVEEGKKPDLNAFTSKMKQNYDKIPKHIKNDIFKMYYHKIKDIDFEERTDKNYTQYKFIEKANNPVGKIMSETSNLKSSIFTRNILQYFISRMTLLEYTDEDAFDKMMSGLNGDGDGDQMDQIMKSMFDGTQSKNQMEKTIQDAQDLCKSLDEVMDKDTQEQTFENIEKNGHGAAKLDTGELKKVAEHLAKINLSMSTLKSAISKLMDRSKNYFSAKEVVKFEDIFDTDNIGGIDDYLYLHPKLRKFMIEDIQIKDTKKIGKISIYIDISGSMSGSCGVTDEKGNRIEKLDFCKAFAYKLQQMDLLKDIYVFNNSVKKINPNVFSIAAIGLDGGTNINKVMQHIIDNDDNALVVTDAEDRCTLYSQKAFFVGVEGCQFSHFDEKVIKKFTDKGQMVMYDGRRIYDVDKKGKVIR